MVGVGGKENCHMGTVLEIRENGVTKIKKGIEGFTNINCNALVSRWD